MWFNVKSIFYILLVEVEATGHRSLGDAGHELEVEDDAGEHEEHQRQRPGQVVSQRVHKLDKEIHLQY